MLQLLTNPEEEYSTVIFRVVMLELGCEHLITTPTLTQIYKSNI